MLNILIVHFNTPKLTECLVKSINKYTPDCHIYIFDNSDKFPFVYRQKNIIVFDNTHGQIINFDKRLSQYPERGKSNAKMNNYASVKHCWSVDKCFDLINDNFILLDSDVLLKRDISELWDASKVFVSDVFHGKRIEEERIIPFISFINVNMCKEKGIRFCYESRMNGLYVSQTGDLYDTGAAFYSEAKRLPHKTITHTDYVEHFKAGSWQEVSDKLHNQKTDKFQWLNKNIQLFANDVVVSLTTHGKRINYIRGAINSMLNQTIRPYKIVLTIDKEDESNIPSDIRELIKINNIEIIVGERKIGPNAKYYYCMKRYKNNPIVTVDDDVEYKRDLIERLYQSYLKHDNCVNALRTHLIKYDEHGKPLKYDDWGYEYKGLVDTPSYDLFATGVGGVLYPPNILNIDTITYDMIDKALYADDVFLKWRENELGIKVVYVANPSRIYGTPSSNQEVANMGLALTNNLKFRNDEYIKNIGITRRRNTKVIYTCITGGYDILEDPSYVQDDFDYVCFTDNTNRNGGVWQIRPIPEDLLSLSKVKQQRCIKARPHAYFGEYNLSVWIDGSVDIKKDINQYIQANCSDTDKSIFVGKHPQRNCTYAECRACVLFKKESQANVDKLTARYRSEGLPENNGMVQTCIMIRKHNDPECKRIMDMWAEEIKANSHRDQLSFNYVLWKLGDKPFKYLNSNLYHSEWFDWNSKHGTARVKVSMQPKTEGDKDLASTMKEVASGQKEQRALTQLRDDIVSVSIKSKPKQTHNGYLSLVKRGAMKKDTRTFIQAFR